jgi:hypothetical protein
MKDAGKWDNVTNKGSLVGVKLPWLYSTYVFDPIGAFYGDDYNGYVTEQIRKYSYIH